MVTLSIIAILLFVLGITLLVVSRKIKVKLLAVALLGLSAGSTVFCLTLNSYTAFTSEQLAATVKVEKKHGQLYDMVVTLRQAKKGSLQGEETYLLKGNQWMVDGDILKWKPALNVMGLKTLYKITRVSGRSVYAQQQVQAGQTMYTVNGGTDWFWFFLHRYQQFFPFVEAVYGNGAYAFGENKTFGVYVTTSGFIIKEYREQ